MIRPIVNQQTSIDPQPHTVCAAGVEREVAARERLNPTSPANAKTVRTNARQWFIRPGEVDVWIDLLDRNATEIKIIKIFRTQPKNRSPAPADAP
jgi:hypothetical protein